MSGHFRMLRRPVCVVLLGAAGAASAGMLDAPVDNCTTFLGSLSTELRIARALPPGTRTSFACPRERESRAAVGASRQRVLNALGPPDRTETGDDGGSLWRYRFGSRLDAPGTLPAPLLEFRFDGLQNVASVGCRRTLEP